MGGSDHFYFFSMQQMSSQKAMMTFILSKLKPYILHDY